MAHHYGNLLQKHPSYSLRGTLRQKKKKQQRERDSEKQKGRGKREKQIEVVQQRGLGGVSREIDNQRLTASEFEDTKEKKRGRGI